MCSKFYVHLEMFCPEMQYITGFISQCFLFIKKQKYHIWSFLYAMNCVKYHINNNHYYVHFHLIYMHILLGRYGKVTVYYVTDMCVIKFTK